MSRNNFYEKEKYTALQAKFEAQKIAFAPFVFQATLALRDFGILKAIDKSKEAGISLPEIVQKTELRLYAVKVLIEAALGIGLILLKDEKYTLSNLGYFVLHDKMTEVNMNFVQDVNYQGFFHLKEALLKGKPEGLKALGPWETIYQGLAHLPEKIKDSWFNFDHYYSDGAFDYALEEVFKNKPKRLMDIGGNTGKWALKCLAYDPDVRITIVDLPGQLRMAEKNITEKGFAGRVDYCAVDLLRSSDMLPKEHDAIWMSQFLDCFSMEQIVSILQRAAEVMEVKTKLYILETYWDRQQFEAAAFCLQQTSLYFTCLANGNSQMYHSEDMLKCLSEAGLKVQSDIDGLGISHTLLTCTTRK